MNNAFVWPDTAPSRPPFVPLRHNKENQDPSKRKQFLMPTERSDVAAHFHVPHLSPSSSKKKGREKKSAFVHIYAWLVSHIDAHLCLSSTWQPFFPLPKITFIISVSNTYWPAVSLWHIPAAHNHGCLQLSIRRDLLAPFFIHCGTKAPGR